MACRIDSFFFVNRSKRPMVNFSFVKKQTYVMHVVRFIVGQLHDPVRSLSTKFNVIHQSKRSHSDPVERCALIENFFPPASNLFKNISLSAIFHNYSADVRMDPSSCQVILHANDGRGERSKRQRNWKTTTMMMMMIPNWQISPADRSSGAPSLGNQKELKRSRWTVTRTNQDRLDWPG